MKIKKLKITKCFLQKPEEQKEHEEKSKVKNKMLMPKNKGVLS